MNLSYAIILRFWTFKLPMIDLRRFEASSICLLSDDVTYRISDLRSNQNFIFLPAYLSLHQYLLCRDGISNEICALIITDSGREGKCNGLWMRLSIIKSTGPSPDRPRHGGWADVGKFQQQLKDVLINIEYLQLDEPRLIQAYSTTILNPQLCSRVHIPVFGSASNPESRNESTNETYLIRNPVFSSSVHIQACFLRQFDWRVHP